MHFLYVLLVLLGISQTAQSRSYSADNLFEVFSSSIFQVKIVDIESGSQSSIGTGFIVADGNSLATNYHVVASLVHQPDQYRAEISLNGLDIELTLDSFDIVHDLALLVPKTPQPLGQALSLSSEAISKGKPLFSIGNPHDIGMTVVEGTYNGLVEHQFLDLIHFSGSINPGMSGGPVIDTTGAVVGVNVATSGDQIGFLVPVGALQALINNRERNQGIAFSVLIQEQVSTFTNHIVDELLSQSWQLEPMGEAKVLGVLSPRMECWGNSHKNNDNQMDSISKGCSNNDSIYIEQGFTTGTIEYEFEYREAYEWNTHTFYQFMTQHLLRARPGNSASDGDVENYRCHINVVTDASSNIDKKVNYCVRPYVGIDNLFDVFYLAASVDKTQQMLIEHYTMAGVTESSATKFFERFIGGATSWQ